MVFTQLFDKGNGERPIGFLCARADHLYASEQAGTTYIGKLRMARCNVAHSSAKLFAHSAGVLQNVVFADVV